MMLDFKALKKDSVIVCPFHVKQFIVRSSFYKDLIWKNIEITFFTVDDLYQKIYFQIKQPEAIWLIHKEFDHSLANSQIILQTLSIVGMVFDLEKKKNSNPKFQKLWTIYQTLIKHNLIQQNLFYKKIFNNKDVYVIGYDRNDKRIINLFQLLNIEPQFINRLPSNHLLIQHNFQTIHEEMSWVTQEIMKLIEKQIDLNKIYLLDFETKYRSILERYFTHYQIPWNDNKPQRLCQTRFYQDFYALLKQQNDEKIVWEKMTRKAVFCPDIMQLIQDCYRKARFLSDRQDFISFFDFLAKQTNYNHEKQPSAINIIQQDALPSPDSFVFVLGFDHHLPLVDSDHDYLTDQEKQDLNLNTNCQINLFQKQQLISFITSNPNIILTYAKYDQEKECYPSCLLTELNIRQEEIDPKPFFFHKDVALLEQNRHNQAFHKIVWTSRSTLKKYDSSFQTFSSDFALINFSPTVLEQYALCPFAFFIKYILKIDSFQRSYKAKIGTYVHQIFKDFFNKTPLTLDAYKQDLENIFDVQNELFFAKRMLDLYYPMIKQICDWQIKNKFFTYELEKTIVTSISGRNFKIQIDKIIFDNQHKTIFIFDYKTSDKIKLSEELLHNDLNIQILIYCLIMQNMIANCSTYNDYRIGGAYLHKLFPTKKNEKMISEKLEGFNFEQNIDLNDFLSLNNKTIILQKKWTDVKTTIQQKIEQLTSEILSGKFPIKPIKTYDAKIDSCQYCQYKDICFTGSKNYKIIDIKKEMENE